MNIREIRNIKVGWLPIGMSWKGDWGLPMPSIIFEEVDWVDLPASGTVNLATQPQVIFKPEALYIGLLDPGEVSVVDFRIGNVTGLLGTPGSLPAVCFGNCDNPIEVDLQACDVAQRICVQLKNGDHSKNRVKAFFRGRYVI